MLKFFIIKQVQYNYDIEKIKTYWTFKIKESFKDDDSPEIHNLIREIDSMLGKNILESFSSDSSDESDNNESNINNTAEINSNPKLRNTTSSNKLNRFRDTSNVSRTSKASKKILDQIHNSITTTGKSFHIPNIIRGVNVEYTGPTLTKQESSDDSTRRSVILFF
jgi:hypothetical protein